MIPSNSLATYRHDIMGHYMVAHISTLKETRHSTPVHPQGDIYNLVKKSGNGPDTLTVYQQEFERDFTRVVTDLLTETPTKAPTTKSKASK